MKQFNFDVSAPLLYIKLPFQKKRKMPIIVCPWTFFHKDIGWWGFGILFIYKRYLFYLGSDVKPTLFFIKL